MVRLGVNLDHIATVRQARGEVYPDPVEAALLAELGGADNITCHLREDRRHIQDRDVFLLKEVIKIPLNFEMAATQEMLDIAIKLQPHAVTLVPEKRQELTTEGGLSFAEEFRPQLTKVIGVLKELGCVVSLFVDPDQESIEWSHKLGATAVEIHTGPFAEQFKRAKTTEDQYQCIKPFTELAEQTHSYGMQFHIGHGLHYKNTPFFQHIKYLEEANIGHAIIARALYVGLTKAVSEMKELLNNVSHKPLLPSLSV